MSLYFQWPVIQTGKSLVYAGKEESYATGSLARAEKGRGNNGSLDGLKPNIMSSEKYTCVIPH